MDKQYAEKPQTGQCNSYIKINKELVQCQNRGAKRIDNGLDAGIHCDSCWGKMIAECRSRSW